jgi:hypothetical protein
MVFTARLSPQVGLAGSPFENPSILVKHISLIGTSRPCVRLGSYGVDVVIVFIVLGPAAACN